MAPKCNSTILSGAQQMIKKSVLTQEEKLAMSDSLKYVALKHCTFLG